MNGVTEQELADAAQLSSLADETPEGRSIVVLAKERYDIRERELVGATLVRVHRADPHERRRRRGPVGPQGRGRLRAPLGRGAGRHGAPALGDTVDSIAAQGGTPLVVAEAESRGGLPHPRGPLGVIYLKDIVSPASPSASTTSAAWGSAP